MSAPSTDEPAIGLTRSDVTDDGELRRELDVRPKECSKQFSEGASPQPGVNWVEH